MKPGLGLHSSTKKCKLCIFGTVHLKDGDTPESVLEESLDGSLMLGDATEVQVIDAISKKVLARETN